MREESGVIPRTASVGVSRRQSASASRPATGQSIRLSRTHRRQLAGRRGVPAAGGGGGTIRDLIMQINLSGKQRGAIYKSSRQNRKCGSTASALALPAQPARHQAASCRSPRQSVARILLNGWNLKGGPSPTLSRIHPSAIPCTSAQRLLCYRGLLSCKINKTIFNLFFFIIFFFLRL